MSLRTAAPSPRLRLVFSSGGDGPSCAARIAGRPAGCSFVSARRAGAIDRKRGASVEHGVAVSRAPGAAFRRDLHACGVAGTVRDATVSFPVSAMDAHSPRKQSQTPIIWRDRSPLLATISHAGTRSADRRIWHAAPMSISIRFGPTRRRHPSNQNTRRSSTVSDQRCN